MASNRKGKRQQQELEEEAMAEWLARGHAIKDFTMAKMTAIWMEEDGDDGEDDSLSAKQELMKGLSVLDPMIEQVREFAEKIKETVKDEAMNAVKTAIKYAEIPPLKRRRLLREHVHHVHEMDRESNKYVLVRQRVHDEWETAQAAEKELAFGRKKRNARKAPLLLRSREMKDEADREQHARLLDDIERKRRERMDAELAEKQRQRVAREEFADAQRVYRRKMNMKFWQKQYADAKEYAEHHSLAAESQRGERFAEKVAKMTAEIAQMNGEEEADYAKAFERTPTTSSLGVFGTAFEPGEWQSSIDGGHIDGLDEHTVGLFSSRGFEAENELLRIELMEAQSKVAGLEEKLGLIEQVKESLLADKKMILNQKDKVLMDIKQVNAEHDELNAQLAGPPRRDPTEADKLLLHTLVTRRADLKKQLTGLNMREANMMKRADLAARSEQSLRPILTRCQDVVDKLQQEVGAIDSRQTDLPVIVGRSIQVETGLLAIPEETTEAHVTSPQVNPEALYANVTMASRLKLLENSAIPVKEHYKKAKQQMIEDWKTKELKSLGEHELEVTKNRLGNLRDRMIEHQKDSLRADLMLAIRRFHEGSLKLRKCVFPIKGRFEWWQAHDPSRSTGLHYFEDCDAVCLNPNELTGQLRGCIRLPKNCFYRINLAYKLLKRRSGTGTSGSILTDIRSEEEDVVNQVTEKINLYIGTDYDSLQEQEFLDVGGNSIRAGEVSFEFYGTKLCYAFSAAHLMGRRQQENSYCLALANAASFEERISDFREEESRMRLMQKESHLLSELVKTLRMQTKKTSSERCADLLEELVHVETSKAKVWDSALLHGHQQRFERHAYASMLRNEIKKELTHQIDEDVLRRKGRIRARNEASATVSSSGVPEEEEYSTQKLDRRDASSMEFLARKHALVEPHYVKQKQSLGHYCSFKLPEFGEIVHKAKSRPSKHAPVKDVKFGTYHRESLVMGLRLEWREGKTKLQVMHKLYESENRGPENGHAEVKPQWRVVESANAVFLASACAKTLRLSRDEEAKERGLVKQMDKQVQQLQQETLLTIENEREAEHQEAVEDEVLRRQKEQELSRRTKLLFAEAMRNTTYNEQISSQIEFLAQRKMNVLNESSQSDKNQLEARRKILQEVKEEYANNFVEGRLSLIKKTWERKERRIQDQREKDRRERAFRIHQEQQLLEAVSSSKAEELALLQREHAQRVKDQLIIPNFSLAVKGTYQCEHRELKAWGSKYDSGMRCKSCGKEMAKSFDDPDHIRGADPQLDRDVEQHRAHTTGGKALHLRNPTHFQHVEEERLRLEKEAREVEISESLLYDRMDPKSIDEFNYRHNMNRHPDLVDGRDPLYQRSVQDSHHAAFQDELLHHGRLKNYHYRVNQLSDMHAHTTTMIAVQHEFLQSFQEENEFVLAKLPLVERDHARAISLVAEDEAALRALRVAQEELESKRKLRERACYAMEGVEEEAEFAEFHAPSLIESSDVMTKIVELMNNELSSIRREAESADRVLDTAKTEYKRTKRCLARLYCRERGTRVRTRYGFCRVVYYREEDSCVVVSPEGWEATMFIPIEEIVTLETANCQAESAMLEAEEDQTRAFISDEKQRESGQIVLMAAEDEDVHSIVLWQQKKVEEEASVRATLCHDELVLQFEYETKKRRELLKTAAEEAKKMNHYTRVSLQRRNLPGKGHARSSRLDIMRVARACEKRLAMASIEQALVHKDFSMRHTFQQERDIVYANQLSNDICDQAFREIVRELCVECMADELFDLEQSHRSHNQGLVIAHSSHTNDMARSRCTKVKLERLWLARRQKIASMHGVWQKEYVKVLALRQELARRDEILRQQEAERILLETRRKEMLAEERWCRKFYLEELVQCMRERKDMANAEMEMREYLRQLELEAMKAKYAAMIDERNKTNDKAARRLEIKLGKNEKHRLYREWAQIKMEDELATHLRDEEIARAQAEALEQLAQRFLLQQVAEGKLIAEREAARVAERIEEAQRIEAEKRAAFESKLEREQMMATVEAYHTVTSLELQLMNAEERSAFWRSKGYLLAANLVPMEAELKRILAEKDHVVADAKAKRSYAELCKQHAKMADTALRVAIEKEEKCNKSYKKIHFLNSTMDSEVLHGRPQRFSTRYLRDQLHKRYFYLLTESIIRRAIVEGNEREAARLERKLKEIEEERAFKIKQIGALKRKRRRQFHMQLKRSELGKKLFGFTQRRLLKERFQQWVKLWSQRVMVRSSFEVKHGLLMQRQRVEAKQAQLKRADINTKLSILHQYQKRRVVCRLCKTEYTEDQNNRYSCSYHSGAYELACVKTCVTRRIDGASMGSATAANCMMHRARRWLCCDATDEGRYGSNGCARRFHLPQRENPALQQLAAVKEREETTLLSQIQQQLDELKERNTFGKAKKATKASVKDVEQQLAAKRAVAAKYHTLDRR